MLSPPLASPFSASRENRRSGPAREEDPMDRMIAVIDTEHREVIDRASTTLTLDLRLTSSGQAVVVSLDLLSHGHYLATTGSSASIRSFRGSLLARARRGLPGRRRRGRASSSIAAPIG